MHKNPPSFYVAIALIILLSNAVTYAILTASRQIPTGANVVTDVNIAVFGNDTTTEELTFIDWGDMIPTQTVTRTIWIENLAAIDLAFDVATFDWNPLYAESEFTFTVQPGIDFPAGSYPILFAGRKASLILTLTALDNPPSGAFSFTISISASSL